MNEFTASNGIRIIVRDGGTVQFIGQQPESSGILQVFPRSEWWQVLREFFEHERDLSSKPWLAAEEGEAWAITYDGAEYPAIFQAGLFRDHGGAWDMESITAGRRLWPEATA